MSNNPYCQDCHGSGRIRLLSLDQATTERTMACPCTNGGLDLLAGVCTLPMAETVKTLPERHNPLERTLAEMRERYEAGIMPSISRDKHAWVPGMSGMPGMAIVPEYWRTTTSGSVTAGAPPAYQNYCDCANNDRDTGNTGHETFCSARSPDPTEQLRSSSSYPVAQPHPSSWVSTTIDPGIQQRLEASRAHEYNELVAKMKKMMSDLEIAIQKANTQMLAFAAMVERSNKT